MDHALTALSGADSHKNRTLEWLNDSSYTFPGPEGGLANCEHDHGVATRLYSLCLRVLRQICRQEQYNASNGDGISKSKEELGKLYLWGQAFRDGKLDRALEYSDEVRNNVLELLGHIGSLLLREVWPSSTSVLESSSSLKPPQEMKYLIEQTRAITSNEDIGRVGNARIENEWSATDQDDISKDGDTGDVLEELGLYTGWLKQLGPTLEQNLIHAENARLQVLCPPDVPFFASGPAAMYISLVREKYRRAQNQLVERLGEANWQRHVGVRKMEASVDDHDEMAVAKSVFRPYSAFHDSGIGTSVQYAPSHTSFLSSNAEEERNSFRVPATPAEVHENKPFQCFLCKSMLSTIKNRIDWKIHIFSDLQPYICTFSDCIDELAQFPTRTAWAQHEFSKHRTTRSWTCPECLQEFSDTSGWEEHLLGKHRISFSAPNLQVAKDMARRTEATRIEDDECPLCRIVVGKSRRGFVKHVARHMEEIALMALPLNVEEDTEEGSTSTDRSSLEPSSQHLGLEPPIEKKQEEVPFDADVTPLRAMSESRVQSADQLTLEEDQYHPGVSSDSKKEHRGGRAAPEGRCYSCNSGSTPQWRHGPDGPRTLCNACGLHYAKLNRKVAPKASIENLGKSRYVEEDNLLNKPRCQPCRKRLKGCDRRRPCQRCNDAGLDCISEDESSGHKGRFGGDTLAGVKQEEQDNT